MKFIPVHKGLQDMLIKFENDIRLESMTNAVGSWINIRIIFKKKKKQKKE